MSFDLRIRFTGLMMWVPEGEKAMHVLLPAMPDHVHGGDERHDHHHREKMPPHFARLVYDAAYELADQTQLSREYVMVDLTNSVLDFTEVRSPEGIDTTLPGELPNMDAVAEPVERGLVEQMPDERLTARITLGAGVLTDYVLGAPYTFEDPEKPQRIAPATEWTTRRVAHADAEGDAGDLRGVVVRRAAGGEPLPTLHPIGQTIHMEVFYVVADFLPPHDDQRFNPEDEGSDAHFGAYYRLCRPAAGGPRLPRASTAVPVKVRNRVERDGPQLPGSICGQAKGTLA
ncbi:MAG: hypothetical protein KY467_08270 [Gemmatimonadetes bacterium]|nr:hypothetical protein [Gemmatimonadota bacterium]